MKPTGATKETTVTNEWTLSKPLTNQIIGSDLRKGLIGTMPAYGIDVPDKEGRTHFAGVLVFGDEQRAKDIIEAINERERLRETLRDIGIRLHGIQLHASSGAENAYDIASDLRGLRDQILRTLNDATTSTSAGGG